MIDQEARSERIALKMDSHISEADAIRQTDAEYKAKQSPECIARLKAHQERVKQDHAEKMAKRATRFNYD
jgi:hypothetical protein